MTLTTYTTAARSDAAAIHRYIKGLREIGWEVNSLSDGEVRRTVNAGEPIGSIVADLTAVDESRLYLEKGQHKASIFFVMGNSPWEVAADSSYYDEWNADLAQVEEAINLEGM